jgi:hypothetical protein
MVSTSLLADAPPSLTAPPTVSAGTITITGLVPGDDPLTLLPTPTDGGVGGVGYVSANGLPVTPIFQAGAPLSVSAAGADVPPFAAQLVAPTDVNLVSPPAGSTIDTSTDLPIAWSGGATEEFITIEFGSNASGDVLCFFDSTLQTAVVPKEALAPLAGRQGGYIGFNAHVAVSTIAGSIPVAFAAFTAYQRGPAAYE